MCARGDNGRREWLSTVYEPERQPSLEPLLALLDHHDQKYFAPRRDVFNFPAAEPSPKERKLIAERRALLGTSAYLADRCERRRGQAILARRRRLLGAPALRDGRTSRRLDSRQALQAVRA